jgi:hypothetical protein
VVDVRPQVVIDRYSSRVADHPGGFKTEVLKVGGPADGGEYGAGLSSFIRAAAGEVDDNLLAAAFEGLDRRAGDDLDAFGLERPAQRRGNTGISGGNQPRASLEQPDISSEVGKDRGYLAACVGSADDRDLRRQGCEAPDVLVGQRELAAGDRQRSRTTANRHHNAVRAPAAAVFGTHGVRAGEPDGAEVLDQVDPLVAKVTCDVLLIVGVPDDAGAVG